ncbi:MAG: sulfate adenylyltransferase subunit CysN [Woeseiaceae bacterium]|nr:sulfate adenylyltransferase subunit CysN [Woeseiaceae bacterium]
MAAREDLASADIATYLAEQEQKTLLRFITCGSVDDGKSTLIGRLLFDSKLIYEDQLAAVERDSKVAGTQGEKVDLALLVDGLAAEREQGITIDVAYRFFSTDRRKFIVADTPGHEQYTRNMATGASTADVAVLLIDARNGVQAQTRRHAYITSLLGIRHVVVAVNKMDLVDFAQSRFDEISREFDELAGHLEFASATSIPVSALDGDNVTARSTRMPWYEGPALLGYLEEVDVSPQELAAFRMPVQWVNRPNHEFRGFCGTIAAGTVARGDAVIAMPSGRRSTVDRIVSFAGDLDRAVSGQAVTLTLADEIDVSRGDVLCSGDDPAEQSDQFAAHIVWMHAKPLLPGRQYRFKTDNQTVLGSVTDLKYKVDVNSFAKQAGKTLELNDIGVANIALAKPVVFAPYRDNRRLGSFIIIDRQSNETVGAGMLDFSLRRAANVVWQELEIGKAQRAAQKHQRP